MRLAETESDAAAERREAASQDEAEARMRQALGLFGQRPHGGEGGGGVAERRGGGGGGGGGGHMQVGARRHRFVQDGEVQVSVVRGRRDLQAASLAPALPRAEGRDDPAAERTAREQAERKLADAQTAMRTLQTRLGHAELERDEAIEAARLLREELASQRAPSEERPARPAAVETRRERVAVAGEPVAQETVAGEEPEPVKWWL